MTRINAGSVLANQYAPPFVVSNNVTTNWQLRWNADLIAFEAFDPSENVEAAGFDTIEQALFVNVSNQQVFVVPWVAASEQSLYVTHNGVKQHTNAYTILAGSSTTTITTSVAISTGDVEIIGLQSEGGATIELANDVGDGTLNQQVVLTWLAPSEQSLLITIQGIKQDTSAYQISSNALFTATTVTFNGTITIADEIEIVGITTTGETPASPVETANLEIDTGTSMGLVDDVLANRKVVTGETQTLKFKNIAAGTGITLADNTTNIAISADVPTFVSGPGTSIIDDVSTTDPLKVRGLAAGDRVALSVIGTSPNEQVQIDYALGNVEIQGNATPYTMLAANRIIGITNLTIPIQIDLVSAATLASGDTITIKNKTAAVDAITVNAPGAEVIDSVGTKVISGAYTYVTLYSDGSNYYVISEG